ncbi:MAG: hypothetical protein V9H25_14695 [Candidatus Competibacter sp.]
MTGYAKIAAGREAGHRRLHAGAGAVRDAGNVVVVAVMLYGATETVRLRPSV